MIAIVFFLFASTVHQPCNVSPQVEHFFRDSDRVFVASITSVAHTGSDDRMERGVVEMRISKQLLGRDDEKKFKVEYVRSKESGARYRRPLYSPWNNIELKKGDTLLVLVDRSAHNVVAVQNLTSPDDPVVSTIESAIALTKASDEVLITHLSDACNLIRTEAIVDLLDSGRRCLPGSDCRDRVLSRWLQIVNSPEKPSVRVAALHFILKNVYYGYEPGASFNYRIISIALRHLNDSDINIRRESALFLASLFGSYGGKPDLQKLSAQDRNVSLDKLKSDINHGANFSDAAKVVVQNLQRK